MNWKAFTTFTAKDEISGAVEKAQKNTEKSSKRMGEDIEKTGRKVDGLASKWGDIAKGVAVGTLIAAGVTKGISALKNLTASVGEFAARCDTVRVSAMKIGVSTEGFQRLAYAAETNNVSVDKLSSGFNLLNKQLGEMQRGQGSLYKYLGDNNKALLGQVQSAKSNSEVFGILADAISQETDIAKRAALGTAAFGKSWSELYPLLAQGAEGIKKAGDAIPSLISDRQIAAANLWNNSIGEIKRNIQGFGDVIRNAVIQYVGPYVLALKEWITANREIIKARIHEYVQKAVNVFKKAVSVIAEVIKKVQSVVKFFQEWGRLILVIGGSVAVFWGFVSAIVAIKNAITVAKAAMTAFNAVVAANPIAIVVLVIAAAVAGFMLLANKVGGVVNALIVVGQTMMKWILTPFNLWLDLIKFLLPMGAWIGIVFAESFKAAGQTIMKCMLTPINLVISGIHGLVSAVGHIPGANWAKDAARGIKTFQDSMNEMLTGSTSTLLSDGPAFLLDPARNAANGMADKVAAAESWAMSGVSGLQGFQDTMNRTLTGSESRLTTDPAGFLFDPYDRHRAAYLNEHPEAATGGDDSALERKFEETIAAIEKGFSKPVPVDVNVTAPEGGPAGLRWSQCGIEDFYETQRLGI
jgi:hypothetical protein